jgi:hypothetical protein
MSGVVVQFLLARAKHAEPVAFGVLHDHQVHLALAALVTATVSTSLRTSGSASSAGSSTPAQSPPVTVSVTGGACLDVGPLGVCLDV